MVIFLNCALSDGAPIHQALHLESYSVKSMKQAGNLYLKMSLRVTRGRRFRQGYLAETTIVVNLAESCKITLPFHGSKLHDVFTFVVDDALVGQVCFTRRS